MARFPVAPAELTLTNGQTSIVVRKRTASYADPVLCREWDLGAPEARYTATPRPGSDGADIGQGFVGQRTVTLDLQILGDASAPDGHDPYWYVQQLTAMCHPNAQPVLTVDRGAGTTYTMALRGNPWSLSYTSKAGAIIEVQLSFTCPLGLLEGPLRSVGPSVIGSSSQNLLSYPVTYPKTYGTTSSVLPTLTVPIEGTSPVAPIVYISGPVSNPKLRTSDGDYFTLTGLSLTTGQVVQINMETGTVIRADAGASDVTDDNSVFTYVDFGSSSFWRWLPGTHSVVLQNTSGSITVQWRERVLTV